MDETVDSVAVPIFEKTSEHFRNQTTFDSLHLPAVVVLLDRQDRASTSVNMNAKCLIPSFAFLLAGCVLSASLDAAERSGKDDRQPGPSVEAGLGKGRVLVRTWNDTTKLWQVLAGGHDLLTTDGRSLSFKNTTGVHTYADLVWRSPLPPVCAASFTITNVETVRVYALDGRDKDVYWWVGNRPGPIACTLTRQGDQYTFSVDGQVLPNTLSFWGAPGVGEPGLLGFSCNAGQRMLLSNLQINARHGHEGMRPVPQ